jgi:alpha-D-ribose 1-methylphosphonate 5-triphosphate synthase subunit PhnH
MTATLAGIALPDDIQWVDEFTAWRVGQLIRPTLTGALIVQESALQAGRPITLQGFDDGSNRFVAPITLAQLQALQALEEVAGAAPMTLVLLAAGDTTRSFTVRFRRTDGPAIEARPIKYQVPAEAGDWFIATLRLIQV